MTNNKSMSTVMLNRCSHPREMTAVCIGTGRVVTMVRDFWDILTRADVVFMFVVGDEVLTDLLAIVMLAAGADVLTDMTVVMGTVVVLGL